MARKAGFFQLAYNGITLSAVGDITVNLGQPKREVLLNSTGVDGYSEKPQAPMVKGEIRDDSALRIKDDILAIDDATVTVVAGNGKTYMVTNAFYVGDGEGSMENGTWQFEIAGTSAEEIG